MGSWLPYYFLSFSLRFNQRFQFREFIGAQFVAFQEALHHGRQRAVEGVFQRIKKLPLLGLGAGDGGAVQREVAKLLGGQQPFRDHPIHQGADGAVGPLLVFVQFLLNGGRGARFVFPNGLDDGPFGLGEFNSFLGHG